MKRSEERTRALFAAQFLRPCYRLGRKTRLVADLLIEGAMPQRIDLSESTLEKTNLTFEQLPKAFRDGILDAVRRGLAGEGLPKPGLQPGDRIIPWFRKALTRGFPEK